MKKLLLLTLIVLSVAGLAWQSLSATLPAPPKAETLPASPPPGVEAARALSTITGVAISPLLGVGVVGAYDYFKLPKAKHHWYASPFFWVPALLLVVLVGLKDLLGATTPNLLKKPFDVAETVENKLSALIMAGAFVPIAVAIFPHAQPQSGLGYPLAMLDAGTVLNTLLVPLAWAIFAVVWLVFHSVHALILLSPFSSVDAALKAFRLFVLALVAATSLANAFVGAALAAALIVVCYFLSGWAFRLLVLSQVFLWDVLTLRHRRFTPTVNANWMFNATALDKTPARSYGRLLQDAAGGRSFAYRPWLILSERCVAVPAAPLVVGRGLFYPELLKIQPGTDGTQTLFTLSPRYRTHEEDLRQAYALKEVRDIGLLGGLKAILNWLRGRGLAKVLPSSQPK